MGKPDKSESNSFFMTKFTVAVASTAIAALSTAIGYYIGSHSARDWEIDEDYDVADAGHGEPCKMVFVVRKDLPMTKGKIAAQCGHAAIGCYEKAIEKTPVNVLTWKSLGQKKIALQCDNLDEINRLQTRAARLGVISERVVDAGHTQVDPGSVTVLGLGPAPESIINEISGHLKLL